MQGMIPVKDYTSAAEMIAASNRNHRRFYPVKPPVKLTIVPKVPAPNQTEWYGLPVSKKCEILRDSYIPGDTYKRLADRINAKFGYDLTKCAVGGLYIRNKAGLLSGIEFKAKGGGNRRPAPKRLRPRPVPTMEQCSETLSQCSTASANDAGDGSERVFFVDKLIERMCKAYGVSLIDIKSQRKTRDISFPRMKMMWVLKTNTRLSFPRIGAKFGGRDHTTAIHAVRTIDALVKKKDPRVADLAGWVLQ